MSLNHFDDISRNCLHMAVHDTQAQRELRSRFEGEHPGRSADLVPRPARRHSQQHREGKSAFAPNSFRNHAPKRIVTLDFDLKSTKYVCCATVRDIGNPDVTAKRDL